MELSLPSACFDTKLLPPRPETEECSDTWIVLKNVTCSKLMRSFSLHVPRLRCICCNIRPDAGHSHTRPSCFFFLMQFASTSFPSPSPSHPPSPLSPLPHAIFIACHVCHSVHFSKIRATASRSHQSRALRHPCRPLLAVPIHSR